MRRALEELPAMQQMMQVEAALELGKALLMQPEPSETVVVCHWKVVDVGNVWEGQTRPQLWRPLHNAWSLPDGV